jgi:hypothetical protein
MHKHKQNYKKTITNVETSRCKCDYYSIIDASYWGIEIVNDNSKTDNDSNTNWKDQNGIISEIVSILQNKISFATAKQLDAYIKREMGLTLSNTERVHLKRLNDKMNEIQNQMEEISLLTRKYLVH